MINPQSILIIKENNMHEKNGQVAKKTSEPVQRKKQKVGLNQTKHMPKQATELFSPPRDVHFDKLNERCQFLKA